jgi:hypothetical protein
MPLFCLSRPSKAAEILRHAEPHAGCHVHTQTTLLIAFAARSLPSDPVPLIKTRALAINLSAAFPCRFLSAQTE